MDRLEGDVMHKFKNDFAQLNMSIDKKMNVENSDQTRKMNDFWENYNDKF